MAFRNKCLNFKNDQKYLDKAFEIDSNLVEHYYNKGCVLKKGKNTDEAKRYFKKAIELYPNLEKEDRTSNHL